MTGSWLNLLWRTSLWLCLFLPLAPFTGAGVEWHPQNMMQAQQMPLMPYLDYYIDESLSLDIEEAADPARANFYQPLDLEKLPRLEGITWLRFTIAPQAPDSKAATFLLDMGQSIPGTPVLYDPVRNELSGALEWRENIPAQRNILVLPEAASEPTVCYIRLDGLPGPWFAPMIRTPQNAASNWSSLSRTGAILALGVVMLLCLLRGLSENGQWRIWTALYVAVALTQAIAGMPAIRENAGIGSLLPVLSPGVALMLLPHVGRHLLRGPRFSRSLDIQLILLSIPGAVLAIMPLIPGWAWLDRWLDLWPAGLALFIPTALWAWVAEMGGAKRFLAGCIIPPLFVAVAWYGLDFNFPPNLLASAPLWGVALGALLIAATRAPRSMAQSNAANGNAQDKTGRAADPATVASAAEPIINLDEPLANPDLLFLDPDASQQSVSATGNAGIASDNADKTPHDERGNAPWLLREDAIRIPLDDILREGAALGQCPLSPAARDSSEKMISAGRKIADILSADTVAVPNAGNQENPSEAPSEATLFNLQKIMRRAHDTAAPAAEASNTAISWYMPPYLCQDYKGNAQGLENVLSELLESAVRASPGGSVRVSARHAPESQDLGHIFFTVTDNGSGAPPADRSTLALARAWELAAANGGYLAMESDSHGTNIVFSMHLAVGEDENEGEDTPHIILAADDQSARRELAGIIETIPCRVSEAANSQEALVKQNIDPSAVLVTQGSLAQPAASDMVRKFTELARKAGFTQCHILAITKDDSQWRLLKASGFTHAMIEPVDAEALTNTVAELLGAAAIRVNPEPSSAGNENHKPEAASDNKQESGQVAPTETPAPSEPIDPSATTPDTSGEKSSKAPAAENKQILQDNNGANLESPAWPETDAEEAIALPEQMEDIGKFSGGSATREDENLSEENSEPELARPVERPVDSADMGMGKSAGQREVGEKNTELQYKDISSASLPLTDFIVGVDKTAREQPEPQGELPQKNLVDAAVTLASSVLNQAINNNSKKDGDQKGATDADGGGNSGENDLDPVIGGLVLRIDEAMANALQAFSNLNSPQVATATGQIAAESEKFGLRHLARMARCVERAARAMDMGALKDLLPELAATVERNRLTITQNRSRIIPPRKDGA